MIDQQENSDSIAKSSSATGQSSNLIKQYTKELPMFDQTKRLLCCVIFCVSTAMLVNVSAKMDPKAQAEYDAAVYVAKSYGTRETYYKCTDSTNGETAAINLCIETEQIFQERRLANVIKSLNARLSKKEHTHLSKTVRYWHDFKNSDCRLSSSHLEGGQAGQYLFYDCVRQKYTQQAKEIEDVLLIFSVPARAPAYENAASELAASVDKIYGAQASFEPCLNGASSSLEKRVCINTELGFQRKRFASVVAQLNAKVSKEKITLLNQGVRSWHDLKTTSVVQ
jgi:uncharacterized protein YecT (DUF1311 family)